MRILYLCHRIPYPPDKGDKIRAFHQLKALAERHEIDLFTMADDASDLRHQDSLRQYCRRVTVAYLNPRLARLRALPYFLTRKPLTIPYFYCSELRSEVHKAVAAASYDRIFVYCSAMAQYVEPGWEIPVVADFVDVDSDKWMQYAKFTRWPLAAVYRREGHALRDYECRICDTAACVMVTTAREASLLREISECTRIEVVPNGVDTEHFRPAANQAGSTAPTVGFTGDMSYFPNIEAVRYFAREVLPLIRQSFPATRFLIVGRNPAVDVRKLAEIEGVEVTGFVPDVREYLTRMNVAVAPFSIAAGIQNKILEAMASAVPIVCTSRAAQGLAEEAARAVEVADDPEKMAALIVDLLRNPDLARSKGMRGRGCVTAQYRWGASVERLLQLVEKPFADAPAAMSTARS